MIFIVNKHLFLLSSKASCGVIVSVFISLNIFLHLGHKPKIKIIKGQFLL